MNLVDHYANLYKDAILKIKSDSYQTDKLIDSPSDNRFGITLLIRPDNQVRNRFQDLISALKAIEPDQYYYPNSDMHVTVLSIISCYNGFDVTQIRISDYVELIKKCIATPKHIEIQFRGITASPSCIMVQGFLSDDTLNRIRDELRTNFRNSILEQTIDKRYSIQTAHATVVRFRKELTKKDAYIKVLDDYRDFYFGTCAVDSLELVYNDWYQRNEHVKELYRFEIK
ncbi:mutarotase [Pontibacter sp. 172403-2]|uniref:2'-5' RNA ligase family protein n=1 Tax=Pontibacter rufus TaxID=2791028 RepID=UPI0018AF5A27|nr:mutarotase [Pontibacter sp. 172403-2]MBF9254633.1 mutarotase [Pontibacter sp. 172403-2]